MLEIAAGSMTAPAGSAPSMTANPSDGSLGSYELGPSGAQFNPPAALTVSLSMDLGGTQSNTGLPLAIVGDADTWDLPNQSVAIDQGTSAAVLSAELTHFSHVLVRNAPIIVDLNDPADQLLGIPFEVDAELSYALTSTRLDDGRDLKMMVEKAAFEDVTWIAGPRLTPTSVDQLLADPTGHQAFTQTFTCDEVGPTSVVLSGRLTWSGLVWVGSNNTQHVTDKVAGFVVKSIPFDCAITAATASPKPTPSATPTARPTATPTATPTPTPTPTPATDIWEDIIGDYTVTRAFDDNDCDFKSYSNDEGSIRANADGELWFDIISKAPFLSHMNYHGTWIADSATDGILNAEMQEVDPAFYDAYFEGTFDGTTLTGTETITQNREPCLGKTVTSTLTATKK